MTVNETMEKNGYTANFIKMIAIATMTIDHLAWLLFPGFAVGFVPIGMHLIGRLTAPLMWFFVAEGYRHTSSRWRYFKRLMILAVVSHFAYCFAFGLPYIPFQGGLLNQTSVAWTLACSVLLLMVIDSDKKALTKILGVVAIVAITFPADWSSIAAVTIMYFYTNEGDLKKQAMWFAVWIALYVLIYFLAIDKVYALIQFGTLNSLFLIRKYNGKRGESKFVGKFFYYYYPLHMVGIGMARLWLYGNQNLLF